MFNPRDYWEQYFDGLDADTYDFSQSTPAYSLVHFCGTYLKKGAPVLDLGCGGGRNAHYLAKRGYAVYGVDIAAAAIEFCRKRFLRCGLSGMFKQGTFDHIPFPDAFFAGVICVAAFDHVTSDNARVSIIEIRRVLQSGGTILLTFDPPNMDEDRLDEAEVLPDGTLKFVRGKQAGMLFHRYQDHEIMRLIGKKNIISFEHTENGTRVIVCR
jgi:ubiquinone/menaquinone biosynthesis C-methylase UbiE